jgi:hypothetical protein
MYVAEIFVVRYDKTLSEPRHTLRSKKDAMICFTNKNNIFGGIHHHEIKVNERLLGVLNPTTLIYLL